MTGIALGIADGIWKLVHNNALGVIRVGVLAPGGQYVRVGLILVSGESGWGVAQCLNAIQTTAEEVLGLKLTHLLADAGAGMVAGIRSHLVP